MDHQDLSDHQGLWGQSHHLAYLEDLSRLVLPVALLLPVDPLTLLHPEDPLPHLDRQVFQPGL